MEPHINADHPSWNKGKIIGQKPPLKLEEIWGIRTHLKMSNNIRDLALFNLALDSKLRGCDLVVLRDTSLRKLIRNKNKNTPAFRPGL